MNKEEIFIEFQEKYGNEIAWAVLFIMPFYEDPRFEIKIKDRKIYNAVQEFKNKLREKN